MPTQAVATAPPKSAPAPAEPAPLAPAAVYGVYPRVLELEESAGAVQAVVVVPENPVARAAADKLFMGTLSAGVDRHLAAGRDAFIATGPGRLLREKERQLTDLEAELTAARTEVGSIHREWTKRATDPFPLGCRSPDQ
jgi:hypothetical protein